MFLSPAVFYVARLLKGRTFPGKILLTRKAEPLNDPVSLGTSPELGRSYSENELVSIESISSSSEVIYLKASNV